MMNDLISRQEGIRGDIERLPSAQSQNTCENTCENTCDFTRLSNDLISRQALCEYALNQKDKSVTPNDIMRFPSAQPEPHWIPVSERKPSEEERKEWIDKNLDGIGYLYPCLVTRYSSINPDRTKNNPYVAKHYYDGEDFVNNGEEVCSEYIIAWMPLPEPYKEDSEEEAFLIASDAAMSGGYAERGEE